MLSFHPLCWHYDRQTDKIRFISLLIFGAEQERQTQTFISDGQVYFFSSDIGIDAKTTDGQTMFHFTNYVGIYDRRTKYISFHSSYLGFKQDKRTTYVSFNPQSKQDKRTIEFRQTDKLFHPRYWNWRKTNTVILKNATPLVDNRVAHILSFLQSTSFIFLNIRFMFISTTNMSPSYAENNFDIINDMFRRRTFIVISKASIFTCRSVYKDSIVGIRQCARATSTVEMSFIPQSYTKNELSGLIQLN